LQNARLTTRVGDNNIRVCLVADSVTSEDFDVLFNTECCHIGMDRNLD